MKILSFAVWCECPDCRGKKFAVWREVPGGPMFGEQVLCDRCKGTGVIPGTVDYADFARLLDGMVRR